jgi:hypothetical protein
MLTHVNMKRAIDLIVQECRQGRQSLTFYVPSPAAKIILFWLRLWQTMPDLAPHPTVGHATLIVVNQIRPGSFKVKVRKLRVVSQPQEVSKFVSAQETGFRRRHSRSLDGLVSRRPALGHRTQEEGEPPVKSDIYGFCIVP